MNLALFCLFPLQTQLLLLLFHFVSQYFTHRNTQTNSRPNKQKHTFEYWIKKNNKL